MKRWVVASFFFSHQEKYQFLRVSDEKCPPASLRVNGTESCRAIEHKMYLQVCKIYKQLIVQHKELNTLPFFSMKFDLFYFYYYFLTILLYVSPLVQEAFLLG